MANSPQVSLSVVIPAYNAERWLPLSVPKVVEAIQAANIKQAEIIIVDDGSSDDTPNVAKALKPGLPVKVITQKNSGRFMARKNGALAARYEYILFIDSRIYIGRNSLKFLVSRLSKQADRLVWTSHVRIDKSGNIYAKFWEAVAFIAWRRYFQSPREVSYGLEDFDHYPKGTTCFFVPKSVIEQSNAWFEHNTKSTKASNDDTLLIRHIASSHRINISPRFYCVYHARTSLKQYSKHVYHRGKVFVDGFLRRDGNRFFWPLVLFLLLSVSAVVYLVIYPHLIPLALLVLLAGWLLELVLALLLGVPNRDALSLFVLTPLFSLLYGAGIWSAVFEIYVLKKIHKPTSNL